MAACAAPAAAVAALCLPSGTPSSLNFVSEGEFLPRNHGASNLSLPLLKKRAGFSRVYTARNPYRVVLNASYTQFQSSSGISSEKRWNNLFDTSSSSSRYTVSCKCRAVPQPLLDNYVKAVAALQPVRERCFNALQPFWDRALNAFHRRFYGGRGFGLGLFEQQILLTALHAALTYFVMLESYRRADPTRRDSKKAKERKKEIASRIGRPLDKTNVYEDMIACDVINPQDIDVTFTSIGGLEEVKDSLHELVILPLQRPELFAQGKLLRPQKGVLLYGPPGTGKTLLAKALAKEARAVFINVRLATLMSKWFGEAQRLVTAVFTLANKLQPSIIFIDEVESFLGQRRATEHDSVNHMKTEFMALWDGLTTDQNARIMVVAATNRPWELDEAILRRLPRTFEVGMPDKEQRASILRVILKDENVDEDVDIDYLASLFEGYSGSDLTELCKQAAYQPIRDLLHQQQVEQQANGGYNEEEEVKEQQRSKSSMKWLFNKKSEVEVKARARALRLSDFESVIRTARTSKDAAFDYLKRQYGGNVNGSANTSGAGVSNNGTAATSKQSTSSSSYQSPPITVFPREVEVAATTTTTTTTTSSPSDYNPTTATWPHLN